jgi:hypothetical protein
MKGKRMKARKMFEAIALSILLLVTALTAAVAQDLLISGLYGAGADEKISRETRPQPAGRSAGREKKGSKGELSAAQWEEVIRVAEGLLGLPGSKYSTAAKIK